MQLLADENTSLSWKGDLLSDRDRLQHFGTLISEKSYDVRQKALCCPHKCSNVYALGEDSKLTQESDGRV